MRKLCIVLLLVLSSCGELQTPYNTNYAPHPVKKEPQKAPCEASSLTVEQQKIQELQGQVNSLQANQIAIPALKPLQDHLLQMQKDQNNMNQTLLERLKKLEKKLEKHEWGHQ